MRNRGDTFRPLSCYGPRRSRWTRFWARFWEWYDR